MLVTQTLKAVPVQYCPVIINPQRSPATRKKTFMKTICLRNDAFGDTEEGATAILRVSFDDQFVEEVIVPLNRDGIINQQISFSGATINRATFTFSVGRGGEDSRQHRVYAGSGAYDCGPTRDRYRWSCSPDSQASFARRAALQTTSWKFRPTLID